MSIDLQDTITAQTNIHQGEDGRKGTVRINKEYIGQPESIKQDLNIGKAFYVCKTK